MHERLELLAAMPIFGGLDEATLELLGSLAEPVQVAAGEHFFREGDEFQALYVLQTGCVEIYKSWQTTARLLRRMNTGDCFGEMSLIDLAPRSASARAVALCEALQVTPSILHEIYRHDPEQFTMLHMNIGRELSRRLRHVDDLLFRSLMGEDLPETTLLDLS